jgi:hypothetical protein
MKDTGDRRVEAAEDCDMGKGDVHKIINFYSYIMIYRAGLVQKQPGVGWAFLKKRQMWRKTLMRFRTYVIYIWRTRVPQCT